MHMLLVEDSKDDASLLSDFIAEEKNAPDVYWVSDGREALDYVFRKGKYQDAPRPDVIVLDLGLPRISGYDALMELKRTEPFSAIPVIVLTTSHNPVDDRNCRVLGAHGFYSKPSDLQGYENLVQTLLRSEFPRLAPSPGYA